MNRNKIVNEILQNMPDEICDRTDINSLKLKARYLYLELCKRCHYDIEYTLANSDAKSEIFNLDEDDEKITGICNEFSLIGVTLFKRSGMQAMALDVDENEYKDGEKMNNPLHVYFVFSLGERDKNGNLEFYLADPSFDLKRVHIGCQTKYFATVPTTIKNPKGYPRFLKTIPMSQIKKMDEWLGYCRGNYTDSIIREIIGEIESMKPSTPDENILRVKVEKMLHELKNRVFDKVDEIEVSDRESSYKMIFGQAFSKEINQGLIDFDTSKDDNGNYISTLTVKEENAKKIYVYSDENRTYLLEENRSITNGEMR